MSVKGILRLLVRLVIIAVALSVLAIAVAFPFLTAPLLWENICNLINKSADGYSLLLAVGMILVVLLVIALCLAFALLALGVAYRSFLQYTSEADKAMQWLGLFFWIAYVPRWLDTSLPSEAHKELPQELSSTLYLLTLPLVYWGIGGVMKKLHLPEGSATEQECPAIPPPGQWKRGLFRVIAAAFNLLALGLLLYFLFYWEMYYCERYQRPGYFFADPVWRVPLFILFVEFWMVYFLAGFWKSLQRPFTDGVLRHLGIALATIAFLPLLYVAEFTATFHLRASWLPRGTVAPELLCIPLTAAGALLLYALLLPILRIIHRDSGFANDGTPAYPAPRATMPLWKNVLNACTNRAFLALCGLSVLTLLLAIHHTTTLHLLWRIMLYPKRW